MAEESTCGGSAGPTLTLDTSARKVYPTNADAMDSKQRKSACSRKRRMEGETTHAQRGRLAARARNEDGVAKRGPRERS